MILRRYTVFDELGIYDPAKGIMSKYLRRSELERVPVELSGHYDFISVRHDNSLEYEESKLVLLFRQDGYLYLQIDDHRLILSNHIIEFRLLDVYKVLRVSNDRKVVFELTYLPPVIDPPLSEDPTPFVEEEHFDFALFLANLSWDHERQSRLYLVE